MEQRPGECASCAASLQRSAHQQGKKEEREQDRDVCPEVQAHGLEAGQVQEHRTAQPSYVY